MPAAMRYLNHMGIKTVANALEHPQSFVWANLFAPVEIVESFGLSCVSMETISSYLSGFWIEDVLDDLSDSAGFATTLCSYHRCFLGACEADILPTPKLALTTSMICDGNINTFRYLKAKRGMTVPMIDVPHRPSDDAHRYVVAQLRDLIATLEEVTGKAFDQDALREVLRRENESKALYLEFLDKRTRHDYPMTLTLNLFMLLASHLAIGSAWSHEFFKRLAQDIETYPQATAQRFFWVHLTPYAQPALSEYFNFNSERTIIASDLDLDYIDQLDVAHPLDALADKLIGNVYNGRLERKIDRIVDAVNRYSCDVAVEFCHWGCRQSAGGAQLVRSVLAAQGVPMLVIDGDGVDRRNNQDGQIKTRFEAFLELANAVHACDAACPGCARQCR